MAKLQETPGECPPDFVEGSQEIASLLQGGLPEFHRLADREKTAIRERAIEAIGQRSASSGRDVMVTGHYMLWDEDDAAGQVVCTTKDLQMYTHIIYLNTPTELLLARRENDKLKKRKPCSAAHLQRWQQEEIDDLRRLCRENHILFSVVENLDVLERDVGDMVQHFRNTETEERLAHIARKLVGKDPSYDGLLKKYVVFDADKTLADVDTGAMFWALHAESQESSSTAILQGDTSEVPAGNGCPLKELFGGPLGYSTRAFQQATLMYEDAVNAAEFDELCSRVASSVRIHEELLTLLSLGAGREDGIGVIVVTCGLSRVWENVLDRYGWDRWIRCFGGGRISNGLVMTPAVKAAVVSYLRNDIGMEVWAFGDSPLDLPMLKAANHAVVVVGDEETRSRSMDGALSEAIANGTLKARQLLLPASVSLRLDEPMLPLLTKRELNALQYPPSVYYAMSTPASLLMTPMRDATIQGPALREAHRRTGWYLAMSEVAAYLGVEEYAIQHPHSGQATGYRLLNESQTCIVAIMRGGEPMALGVSDAFPTAALLHAKTPEDLDAVDLGVYKTVILVDSVINNGTTMIGMVERIQGRYRRLRIVLVAGVVQASVLAPSHELSKMLCNGVSLVALRGSANKYTGTKGSDTGNRLFNTTHLD